MTQENKELLLKDLFARLPYNVKVQYKHSICTIDTYTEYNKFLLIDENKNEFPSINDDKLFLGVEEMKLCLFPLSSMTEEQKKEYKTFSYHVEMNNLPDYEAEMVEVECATDLIDWYNENHFDYRGLIPRGLAIDCTNLNIY